MTDTPRKKGQTGLMKLGDKLVELPLEGNMVTRESVSGKCPMCDIEQRADTPRKKGIQAVRLNLGSKMIEIPLDPEDRVPPGSEDLEDNQTTENTGDSED